MPAVKQIYRQYASRSSGLKVIIVDRYTPGQFPIGLAFQKQPYAHCLSISSILVQCLSDGGGCADLRYADLPDWLLSETLHPPAGALPMANNDKADTSGTVAIQVNCTAVAAAPPELQHPATGTDSQCLPPPVPRRHPPLLNDTQPGSTYSAESFP